MLRSAGIPLLGQFSGADFLRDAERFPNVLNLRASYSDEVRLLVDHIVNDLGKTRIGVIYQDDAFGYFVLKNLKAVLMEHNILLLGRANYSRNTHAVHASLFQLAKADLDAVFLIGSYPVNALIINLANALGHDFILASLSVAQRSELIDQIDEPSDRILKTGTGSVA